MLLYVTEVVGGVLFKGFDVNLKYFMQLRKHISKLLLKKKHCNLCYRFIETTLTVALLPFGSMCVTKNPLKSVFTQMLYYKRKLTNRNVTLGESCMLRFMLM
jgi:hypothetical protein